MDVNAYKTNVLSELQRLKKLAENALSQIDDEQLFTTINKEGNSVAVILKHLSGNMRSRWRDFLTTDGEKPDRNRDNEFVIDSKDTKDLIVKRWEDGWSILFNAIQSLQPSDFDSTVVIRGEPHTVVQAINRQMTHYSYHVGQIVFLAKHLRGSEWKSLSVPFGKSKEFNISPRKYLSEHEV